MAKPPPSGPHPDLDRADRDLPEAMPDRDPKKGTAKEIEQAEENSAGRPPDSGKLSDEDADKAGKMEGY